MWKGAGHPVLEEIARAPAGCVTLVLDVSGATLMTTQAAAGVVLHARVVHEAGRSLAMTGAAPCVTRTMRQVAAAGRD